MSTVPGASVQDVLDETAANTYQFHRQCYASSMYLGPPRRRGHGTKTEGFALSTDPARHFLPHMAFWPAPPSSWGVLKKKLDTRVHWAMGRICWWSTVGQH